MHLSYIITQFTIQNRCVYIFLNDALWDMEQVHYGTCEIDPLCLFTHSITWAKSIETPLFFHFQIIQCILCCSPCFHGDLNTSQMLNFLLFMGASREIYRHDWHFCSVLSWFGTSKLHPYFLGLFYWQWGSETVLTDLGKLITLTKLTHCGFVRPYGDMDLGQHWFR